ncbi:Fe-S-containing protein [Desulfuribacillus alkaliarsenatis]|uniref:Membrane iron-sulfur containing protein FtrD-like domain-containing protein n=1 Tax=Desulfuribacillus alkaliarsenatis TaxID=766136 RepID=A0A1E5G4S7_9FIRM|nr:Fe-S-containing protein [Desulfuribacillus alkaliarsenatis]OEF98181.1 hypothetical protein BHF68_00375 [Desulfuribacillus alkaliarsenatis]
MSKNKKQQFNEESRKKGTNLVIAGLILVFIAGFAAYMFSSNPSSAEDRLRFEPGNFNIGTAYAYEQVTPMTVIDNEIQGENVIISLSDVLDVGLAATRVYVENNYKDYMPLTAFINPSGQLVVSLGVCEPCRSETLRIDGEYLICESCRTVWRLDNLQGVNGGCMDYPPEAIYYEVVGDDIVIPHEQLSSWTPRPL